jgi:pimeloyl-ACP methyl ester carboxylesterase
MSNLVIKEYGSGLRTVAAIHGGPAAAGDLAPLARRLSERWRVLEPYQRGSGGRQLTVSTHIQDLDDLLRERCTARPTIIVGHSWGAMLALAYAAEHPTAAAALVLVGCGTFSREARQEFERRRAAHLTPADQEAIAFLKKTEQDANRRLAAVGRVMARAYAYDAEDGPHDITTFDAAAHADTWSDMVRLQTDGVYPAAFAAIECPVLMLHGDTDPHPGRLTFDDLRPCIPHLEYRELARCGHSPWLERQARDEFYRSLNEWLTTRFDQSA